MPRRSRRRSSSRSHRTTTPRRRRNTIKLRLHKRISVSENNPSWVRTMAAKTEAGQLPTGGVQRKIASEVTVSRNPYAETKNKAFVACVSVARKAKECSTANSPSAALSKAMRVVAGRVGKRGAAFAGLGLAPKRRRRKSRK